MTNEVKDLLEKTERLTISEDQGVYYITTKEGINISNGGMAVELTSPLKQPTVRTVEEYLLDEKTRAAANKVDIPSLSLSGTPERQKQCVRAIWALVVVQSVDITEGDKTELSLEGLFPLSKRVSCDLCGSETLVLSKQPTTLIVDQLCGVCNREIKKYAVKEKNADKDND